MKTPKRKMMDWIGSHLTALLRKIPWALLVAAWSRALLVALIMAFVATVSLLVLAAQGSASEQIRGARPAIARLVSSAQLDLSHHKYTAALGALNAANSMKDKSPYEAYVIEETRAAVYAARKDNVAAISALEASLATGMVPRSARQRHEFDLVGLSYRAGDGDRVIRHAQSYYRDSGSDQMPHRLMAQIYYQRRNYARAADLLQQVVETLQSRGERPDQNIFRHLLVASYHRDHRQGYDRALEGLVASYPTPSNWKMALDSLRSALGSDDSRLLFVQRLEQDTGVATEPDRYMNVAQLALLGDRPVDAKRILDDGYNRHILGQSGDIDRQKRLYAMTSRLAQKKLQQLPALETEARSSPTGNNLIALGEMLAAQGDPQHAIEALENGIAKGGLEHEEDARLALGIAYLDAQQPDNALKAFARTEKEKGPMAHIAALWAIHAHTPQHVSSQDEADRS